MSCFGGRMKEYKKVSLDRFDGENLKSTVFFLSHCHQDHMVGLSSPAFLQHLKSHTDVFLHCSPVTKILLLASDQYRPLAKYVKELDVQVTNLIDIPDHATCKNTTVQVTLLPAGHCPGSVMVLMEGDEGTVLYTGDFRWESHQAASVDALHFRGSVKAIKSLYIDTTFCTPRAFHFPSRQECVEATTNLARHWLEQSPGNVVHISSKTNYGHEHLLKDLALQTGEQVHTSDWKVQVYSQIEDLEGVFSADPSSRIHACYWSRERDEGSRLPCGYAPADKQEVGILRIRPSTMWFTLRAVHKEDLVVRPHHASGLHRVCYSFHSSYSELRDLVSYLRPQTVHPNVVPVSDSDISQVMVRLRNFLQLPHRHHIPRTLSSGVHLLGKLKLKKTISPRKRALSDSEGLVFDSPEKKRRRRRESISLSQSQGSQPMGSRETTPDLQTSPGKAQSSQTYRSDASQAHSSYFGSAHSETELDLFTSEPEEAGKEEEPAQDEGASLEQHEEAGDAMELGEASEESLRLYISGDEDVDEEDRISPVEVMDSSLIPSVENCRSDKMVKAEQSKGTEPLVPVGAAGSSDGLQAKAQNEETVTEGGDVNLGDKVVETMEAQQTSPTCDSQVNLKLDSATNISESISSGKGDAVNKNKPAEKDEVSIRDKTEDEDITGEKCSRYNQNGTDVDTGRCCKDESVKDDILNGRGGSAEVQNKGEILPPTDSNGGKVQAHSGNTQPADFAAGSRQCSEARSSPGDPCHTESKASGSLQHVQDPEKNRKEDAVKPADVAAVKKNSLIPSPLEVQIGGCKELKLPEENMVCDDASQELILTDSSKGRPEANCIVISSQSDPSSQERGDFEKVMAQVKKRDNSEHSAAVFHQLGSQTFGAESAWAPKGNRSLQMFCNGTVSAMEMRHQLKANLGQCSGTQRHAEDSNSNQFSSQDLFNSDSNDLEAVCRVKMETVERSTEEPEGLMESRGVKRERPSLQPTHCPPGEADVIVVDSDSDSTQGEDDQEVGGMPRLSLTSAQPSVKRRKKRKRSTVLGRSQKKMKLAAASATSADTSMATTSGCTQEKKEEEEEEVKKKMTEEEAKVSEEEKKKEEAIGKEKMEESSVSAGNRDGEGDGGGESDSQESANNVSNGDGIRTSHDSPVVSDGSLADDEENSDSDETQPPSPSATLPVIPRHVPDSSSEEEDVEFLYEESDSDDFRQALNLHRMRRALWMNRLTYGRTMRARGRAGEGLNSLPRGASSSGGPSYDFIDLTLDD